MCEDTQALSSVPGCSPRGAEIIRKELMQEESEVAKVSASEPLKGLRAGAWMKRHLELTAALQQGQQRVPLGGASGTVLGKKKKISV